ncbi:MAG: HPP family protein [Nitrospirae bacterium]|nr:HPP family protein [Nitrospirota bacterium]MBF0535140.1 HPP family protein [Nitrospirota bacterium]MBF0615241.1 HPP family protein [Nitrospirota bacterium]
MLEDYLSKMKGKAVSPARVSMSEVVWSWTGAFLGILAVAYISYNIIAGTGFTMIIGSFGASAVLIYGAIKSPLAQPRNLIGGHVISAIIGVTCYKLFHIHMWLAAPLAVATAIAVMHMTRTLHPPGGATALIAVIGGKTVNDLGFMYALVPAGAGAVIMLIIALIVNNIPKTRNYPEYWF